VFLPVVSGCPDVAVAADAMARERLDAAPLPSSV
jgi:hypothetical protein